MATKKKTAQKKKPAAAASSLKRDTKPKSWFGRFVAWQRSLSPRTPHQNFRRTYRRDYIRSFELPGYMSFTVQVWQALWARRVIFGSLVVVYALTSGVLVGLASQDTYDQLSELIRSTSGEVFEGNAGKIGEAGLLLLTGLSGGINPNLSEAQQLMSGFLIVLAWLTTVWLLRAFLAGHNPRLRDGLYNAGAPLVPSILLSVVLILQLVPAIIASIGVSAAMPTGLISQGVEAMLFWTVVLLLVVLSLYWLTSTLIALVVVTLPGMYPLRALKTAHELVVGRRLRIVLRVVWLFGFTLLAWALVLIPIIVFDAWLKGVWPAIAWLPIVPLALLIASAASVVWVASYVYLLYRKVVDDDAAPA